jgi:DNA-nicking Smr family endonuclease
VTKKTINSEDSDLFKKTIGSVRKVKNDKIVLMPEHKPKPIPKTRVSQSIEDHFHTSQIDDLERLSVEDTLHFSAIGLQKNVLKRLRQGYFGLDAEIDLHGLNSHDAKQRLGHFLQISVENGWRCVHIIHGKGYRSADNHPVLKNNLNLWLRQHRQVLAFCSAPQRQGGAGAVYVLLQLAEKYDINDDKNEGFML